MYIQLTATTGRVKRLKRNHLSFARAMPGAAVSLSAFPGLNPTRLILKRPCPLCRPIDLS